jgi:hypothetical protein
LLAKDLPFKDLVYQIGLMLQFDKAMPAEDYPKPPRETPESNVTSMKFGILPSTI